MEQSSSIYLHKIQQDFDKQLITIRSKDIDLRIFQKIQAQCDICKDNKQPKNIRQAKPEQLHFCTKQNQPFYYFYCQKLQQLLIGIDIDEITQKSIENSKAFSEFNGGSISESQNSQDMNRSQINSSQYNTDQSNYQKDNSYNSQIIKGNQEQNNIQFQSQYAERQNPTGIEDQKVQLQQQQQLQLNQNQELQQHQKYDQSNHSSIKYLNQSRHVNGNNQLPTNTNSEQVQSDLYYKNANIAQEGRKNQVLTNTSNSNSINRKENEKQENKQENKMEEEFGEEQKSNFNPPNPAGQNLSNHVNQNPALTHGQTSIIRDHNINQPNLPNSQIQVNGAQNNFQQNINNSQVIAGQQPINHNHIAGQNSQINEEEQVINEEEKIKQQQIAQQQQKILQRQQYLEQLKQKQRVNTPGYFYQDSNGQNSIQINCQGCHVPNSLITLSKKEQNQNGEAFKRVLCQKCNKSVYFIFCECGEVVYSHQEFKEPIIECSYQCDKLNYVKCKGTNQDSKPCNNNLEVSIKNPQIKGQFYCEVQCSVCSSYNQYFYCKCMEIITNLKGKQKDFQYGKKIICPNNDCAWKTYSLVRCPIDSCDQVNIFTDSKDGEMYQMGSIVQCLGCQSRFQQVTCPKCSDSLYFQGDYVIGKPVECPSCMIQFQQVSCPLPKCQTSIYRDINTDTQIENGQQIICTEQGCGNTFYNHICENCLENLALPNDEGDIRLSFHEGRYYKCDKCNCYQEIYTCPKGHTKKNQLSKSQLNQIERNYLSFGERECTEIECKDEQKMFFFLCPHKKCQKVNRISSTETSDKCKECNKVLSTVKCKNCKSLNSYYQSQNPFKCITCRHEIQTEAGNEKQTVCKICYENQAEYFMSNCRHLVACTDCHVGLNNMGNGKCPICRQAGRLDKIYM